MVIARIFQGLGNQLFQYAFVRALSLRHNVPFKLDTTYFKFYSDHRQYGLDKFNIVEHIATEEDIYNVKNGIKKNRLANFIFQRTKGNLPYYKQPYLKEDLSRLDKNLLLIDSNTYVDGYFTSEIFFKDFETQIRTDFQLKASPNKANLDFIVKAKEQNSICISIRRGDFVSNPMHDVCDLDYYRDALNVMNERVSNAVYYIFSDDNDWVKQNFKISQEHYYVTHNYPDFYEDFRLMQNCRHHIIPNSTFSWWAAWLANHPEKIVIAPEIWLNTTEVDYSYFLPEKWVKVHNRF
ncbi:MAG: glycosyl transferase family 11 [Bacteroidota bacterium]|nr:glycosyl transferase family 11 [Bacteroidota bacterium]